MPKTYRPTLRVLYEDTHQQIEPMQEDPNGEWINWDDWKELESKLGKSENDKDALSTALTNVNRQLLDAQKEIQFLKDEGDEDSEWRDQVADESEAKIKELQSRLQASEKQRDEWKEYADAGLKSYADLQAEIASYASRLEAAQKAIKERDQVCADAMRAHANTLSRLGAYTEALKYVVEICDEHYGSFGEQRAHEKASEALASEWKYELGELAYEWVRVVEKRSIES